ncbi:MAG: hypothetical protein ACE5EA_04550 [Nitrospirota bacterium]
MATKINYMIKIIDAKMGEIKKALEAGGIKVNSIIELHKEEIKEDNPAK